MVVLVFVRLFVGGLLRFFHRSADDGRLHRRRIVLFIVFGDSDRRRVETGGRAGGVRLVVADLHIVLSQRRTTVLSGNFGTLSGENVFGNQTPPLVHRQRIESFRSGVTPSSDKSGNRCFDEGGGHV